MGTQLKCGDHRRPWQRHLKKLRNMVEQSPTTSSPSRVSKASFFYPNFCLPFLNCVEVKISKTETSGPRRVPERARTEVETQKSREIGKFQTIYRNHLLIPTDPQEMPDGTIDERARERCDLREYFEEWNRIENEKQKHIDIAHQLTEMLERGLFRCAPENVFKVILTLKVNYLLRGKSKAELKESFEKSPEEEKRTITELPAILSKLSTNLITIWNCQITP